MGWDGLGWDGMGWWVMAVTGDGYLLLLLCCCTAVRLYGKARDWKRRLAATHSLAGWGGQGKGRDRDARGAGLGLGWARASVHPFRTKGLGCQEKWARPSVSGSHARSHRHHPPTAAAAAAVDPWPCGETSGGWRRRGGRQAGRSKGASAAATATARYDYDYDYDYDYGLLSRTPSRSRICIPRLLSPPRCSLSPPTQRKHTCQARPCAQEEPRTGLEIESCGRREMGWDGMGWVGSSAAASATFLYCVSRGQQRRQEGLDIVGMPFACLPYCTDCTGCTE